MRLFNTGKVDSMFEWSPKVSRTKLARLYSLDGSGIHDENLLDDVASSLLVRCVSIITVTRACMEGLLSCPTCGKDILLAEDAFSCSCGFHATKTQFCTSYKGKVVPFLDKLSASADSWREVMKWANGNFALTSDEGKI